MRIYECTNNTDTGNRRGAATLVVVLLLGGIVIEIGVVGVLLSNFLSTGNLGARLSTEAFAAAQSGVSDAFLRILRNECGDCVAGYNLPPLNNASVSVTVSCLPVAGGCDSGELPTITAAGNALGRHRTLTAVVEVDPFTKVVRLQSVEEL